MLPSLDDISRGGPIALAISVLCFAAAVLQAESPLQIVTPENGLLVNVGGDLTVTIKTGTLAFQSVCVDGDGPFAVSTGLSAPPYQFSYSIPAGVALGHYRLKAVGVTSTGTTIESEPVEVDIEQSEKPKKLESEYQALSMVEHESSTLVIWGIFADGSKVDLTRSTRISYTSDRVGVAAISKEGAISAASSGKAKITVKYADKTIFVPVVVTSSHAESRPSITPQILLSIPNPSAGPARI